MFEFIGFAVVALFSLDLILRILVRVKRSWLSSNFRKNLVDKKAHNLTKKFLTKQIGDTRLLLSIDPYPDAVWLAYTVNLLALLKGNCDYSEAVNILLKVFHSKHSQWIKSFSSLDLQDGSIQHKVEMLRGIVCEDFTAHDSSYLRRYTKYQQAQKIKYLNELQDKDFDPRKSDFDPTGFLKI